MRLNFNSGLVFGDPEVLVSTVTAKRARRTAHLTEKGDSGYT